MKKLILVIAIALFAGLSAWAEPTYRFAGSSVSRRPSVYGSNAYTKGQPDLTSGVAGSVESPFSYPVSDPVADPLQGNALYADNGGADNGDQGFLEPPTPMEDALPVLGLFTLAFAVWRFTKK